MTASAGTAPATGAGTGGPVTLVLPPVPAMVRVGRLTASSIASLADMSIDDIDDIKIAVSEMITLLIQSGNRTSITLRFETTDEVFSVDASTPSGATSLGRNDLALATAVLEAVADEHQIASTDDRLLLRIVKHLAPRSTSPASASA